MSRLTGVKVSKSPSGRKDIVSKFSRRYNAILVLKGHRTCVASPDGKIYVNRTGNPGMASGGVGDVLTGMIASFIGQGLDAYEASCLGVYVHGLAGDLAAKEKGELSLIATDLLDKLPHALKTLA
jgi:NAD(P)H-hydrate epimerase